VFACVFFARTRRPKRLSEAKAVEEMFFWGGVSEWGGVLQQDVQVQGWEATVQARPL
jgi:hypothetical protein